MVATAKIKVVTGPLSQDFLTITNKYIPLDLYHFYNILEQLTIVCIISS